LKIQQLMRKDISFFNYKHQIKEFIISSAALFTTPS
jgi:hypothetical protein